MKKKIFQVPERECDTTKYPWLQWLQHKSKKRERITQETKTNIFYNPLIDNKPTDPSTILTAMYEIERTSKDAGQEVAVFTCDQQLYRIVVDIVWANPGRWASFYPRHGGMHWLMSFIGSVGKLMGGSGLDKLMEKAFARVENMLVGKKYPMNMRALGFVVLSSCVIS